MTTAATERGGFRPRRAIGLAIVTLSLVIAPVAVAAQWSGDSGAEVPDLATTTATSAATSGTTASGQPVVIITQGGTGEEPTSAADALTPGRSDDLGPRRIKYLVGDGWVPIDNGGSVPLGNGYSATVTLTPYPPIDFEAQADFLITRDGIPVTDAEITMVYDMFIMGHGPFTTSVRNAGDGHYLTTFDFFMFGPWELLPRVQVPGGHNADFTLSVYIWPV